MGALLLGSGDIALTDLALTFDFDTYQLQCLNTCRLFLQLITVSDTVTARGDQILPSVLRGERDPHRESTLQWPDIPRPPSTFWSTWRIFLQYFCRGTKIHTPLGHWVATPPCQWRWYQDTGRVVWEHDHRADQWFRYTIVKCSRQQTRQTSRQYSDCSPSAPPLSIFDLFPATVMKGERESIIIVSSATKFPTPHVPLPPNLWQHAKVPDALAGTLPFFQHLISTPLTEPQCSDIANKISEESLVMCSDGAHDVSCQVASHGLVFGSSIL